MGSDGAPMTDWLLPDVDFKPLIEAPKRGGARTLAGYRSALARLGLLHRRYGHGVEGQACRGCSHLQHHGGARKSYLKCALYRTSASEATDWRAKWPSCGAFTAEVPPHGG